MICSWFGVSVIKLPWQVMGAGMTEYVVIQPDPYEKGSHTST